MKTPTTFSLDTTPSSRNPSRASATRLLSGPGISGPGILAASLCAQLLSACSGADGPGAGEPGVTMKQRLDALATCTPSDTVVLLPWTGPAFDEAGRLRAPLPAGHIEAVATGWRNYSPQVWQ